MRLKYLLPLLFTVSSFTLTLKEAQEIAIKNNPQLKAQNYSYLASKNDFYSQIAKRFGEIDLLWVYNQYKFPRVVAPLSGFPLVKDDQVRIYGFQYKVRLFDGCQQFFLIVAKKDKSYAEWLKYEKVASALKSQVAQAYFNYLIFESRLKALRERERAVKELSDIVENAYRLGKRSLVDYLQVRAELQGVKAQIADTKAKIRSAEEKLKALLNVEKLPSPPEEVDLKPQPLDADKLLTILVGKNPDLKILRQEEKITRDYKRVALAQFSPKLDFVYKNLTYSYDGRKTHDWSYTLQATFPIFDFGNRFFTYRRASYEERKVRELERNTYNQVLESFRSLVESLNSQLEVIEATKSRLEFAKKAYEVEKEKYLTGKGNIYDLLKAEALYFETLANYKASIYKWGILKAKLDYLLGY